MLYFGIIGKTYIPVIYNLHLHLIDVIGLWYKPTIFVENPICSSHKKILCLKVNILYWIFIGLMTRSGLIFDYPLMQIKKVYTHVVCLFERPYLTRLPKWYFLFSCQELHYWLAKVWMNLH